MWFKMLYFCEAIGAVQGSEAYPILILRNIATGNSWGYCGKDCFLDKTEKPGSVLREVHDVDILEEKICNEYLGSVLVDDVEVLIHITLILPFHLLLYPSVCVYSFMT